MGTPKPRTNVKRPAGSRSVRVTKKRQGVSRRQAIIFVGVLAVMGVAAVVASRAATRPNNVYVSVIGDNTSSYQTMKRIASDAATSSSYKWSSWDASLSRDKLQLVSAAGENLKFYNSANGHDLRGFKCPGGCYLDPIWLGGDKRIAYMSNPGSPNMSIRAVNTDGTNPKVLVTASSLGVDRIENISQNKAGNKILFSSSRAVYTMNNDGSGVKKLADVGSGNFIETGPAISPDGRQVAFVRRSNNGMPFTHTLMLVNSDGTGLKAVKELARDTAGKYYNVRMDSRLPQWSPGNTSVLYQIYSASGIVAANLYSINVNTNAVTRHTSNNDKGTILHRYGWSSDGRIVYGYGPYTGLANMKAVKSVKSDGTGSKILYQVPAGSDPKRTYITDVDF